MLAVLDAARPAGEPGRRRLCARWPRRCAPPRGCAAGVRPPAAPRRPGGPRAGAGGGRGGAAERRAGARGRGPWPPPRRSRPTTAPPTSRSSTTGQRRRLHRIQRLPLGCDRAGHRAAPQQHAGRGGSRRRPPPGAGQPPDQHAGADHGRARRPAAAGGRLERLEPAALGDHAGDRQRPSGTGCRCRTRSRSPACTSRATGSTARAGSTRRWSTRWSGGASGRSRFDGLNLYFGGANAVSVGADGSLDAAGDPRRDCYGIVL